MWILPTVNLSFAPGWHPPQVFTTFSLLIVEVGSDDGFMLCAPWQLAQFATAKEPPSTAKPW